MRTGFEFTISGFLEVDPQDMQDVSYTAAIIAKAEQGEPTPLAHLVQNGNASVTVKLVRRKPPAPPSPSNNAGRIVDADDSLSRG